MERVHSSSSAGDKMIVMTSPQKESSAHSKRTTQVFIYTTVRKGCRCRPWHTDMWRINTRAKIYKKKIASQNCSAGSKKKKVFCRILHTGRSKEKKGSSINILQNCARYRDPIEEIKTFSRYHLFPIAQCWHSPIIRQVASERGGWQDHVFSAFFAGARPYISRGWHTGRAGTL